MNSFDKFNLKRYRVILEDIKKRENILPAQIIISDVLIKATDNILKHVEKIIEEKRKK